MSALVDQILGRKPVAEELVGSVPPVMAGKPRSAAAVRKQPPKDEEEDELKKKARRSSVVASIMGMTESDDESIIPDNAKTVDTLTGGEHIPGIRSEPLPPAEGPSEPAATTNVDGEELIQPTAALVAPDVTPNVMQPIDPSQVPAPPQRPTPPPSVAAAQAMPAPGIPSPGRGAMGTMDTLLGRQNSQPQPEEAAAMAEALIASMADPAEIQAKVAEAMTPAQPGSSLMPEHKEGDGKTVYSAFRRFM